MVENELKTSISGSFFKFKPEIDATIDEFRDLHVTVLAPDKGWLYIPKAFIRPEDFDFRPLPSERGMSVKQIEDEFLRAVQKSDFLYVENPEGYIGVTVGLEIGFAAAAHVHVFSRYPIKTGEEDDLWFKGMIKKITVATPEEAVKLTREAREKGDISFDLWTYELITDPFRAPGEEGGEIEGNRTDVIDEVD